MFRKYNFDKIINRKNTCSIKWEGNKLFGKKEGLIPLWVADMDFPVCREIVREIKKRASHPIYGYTIRPKSYFDSIINWFKNRYNYEIKREWILSTPGIVPAINFAIQAYTEPGDKIIIQTPVYYPFNDSIINNNRIPVYNSLIYKECNNNEKESIALKLENYGFKNFNKNYLKIYKWEMDINNFEKLIDNKTKLLILCNPANPAGRVWTKEELKKLAEICLKKNIIIVSDEIHCDLTMPEYKYTPLASISDEIANITITCTAGSKTFNIAGLYNSNIIIKNDELRKKFFQVLLRNGISSPNLFGIVSTEAGYKYGEKWLNQVIDYIYKNYLYTVYFFTNNLPEAKITLLQATFLALIDFNPYKDKIIRIFNEVAREKEKFSNEINFDFILKTVFEEKFKIWLDEGIKFGKEASGFMRINIATSQKLLKKAFNNILEINKF